jgi:hypothetical protein
MQSRTHLALEKDAPISLPVTPASVGRIVVTPQIGGSIIATIAQRRACSRRIAAATKNSELTQRRTISPGLALR